MTQIPEELVELRSKLLKIAADLLKGGRLSPHREDWPNRLRWAEVEGRIKDHWEADRNYAIQLRNIVDSLLPHLERPAPEDKCEICKGHRGGVLGNENIIHGVIMCDYCSCTFDRFVEAGLVLTPTEQKEGS